MCDCDTLLVDLRAKFRLMESHYHEDMKEVYDELARLKELVRSWGEEPTETAEESE